jgi:hypothetical protein
VSGERSWGADTVAFGRAREAATPDPAPQRRPPRGPRRRLSRPTNRTIALAGVGVIALVALLAVLGDGSVHHRRLSAKLRVQPREWR